MLHQLYGLSFLFLGCFLELSSLKFFQSNWRLWNVISVELDRLVEFDSFWSAFWLPYARFTFEQLYYKAKVVDLLVGIVQFLIQRKPHGF
jgi:hypothetical protein